MKNRITTCDLIDAKFSKQSSLYDNQLAFELGKALLEISSKARSIAYVADLNQSKGSNDVSASCVSEWMQEILDVANLELSKVTAGEVTQDK